MSKYMVLGSVQVGVKGEVITLNVSEARINPQGIIVFEQLSAVKTLIDHLQKALQHIEQRYPERRGS